MTPGFLETFARWAEDTPDRVALSIWADGDAETARLTFRELADWSDHMAQVLLARGLGGQRLVLAIEETEAFSVLFLACLKAGVTAVPVPAAGGATSQRRLAAILDVLGDAPTICLEQHLDLLRGRLEGWDILAFETLLAERPTGTDLPEPDPQSIAFMQFSSGSTAEPKGICVSAFNLATNLVQMDRHYQTPDHAVYVTWLPYFHDMGLIIGLLFPLHAGRKAIHMPTDKFYRRPLRWLKALSGHEMAMSGAPTAAYDMCVRMTRDSERVALDLSGWKTAFVSAEIIRPRVLDQFADTFASCGFERDRFLSGYGLAEATVMAASGPSTMKVFRENARDVARICSGVAAPGMSIRIADAAGQRVDGQGCIWVKGPNLAPAVWRHHTTGLEDLSLHRLEDEDGLFYNTGDIGFLEGDALYVVDRQNDVLNLGGRNLAAGDVEAVAHACADRLLSDDITFECAVFAEDDGEKENRIILCETSRKGMTDELRRDLSRAISRSVFQDFHFPLEVHFVRRGHLLRTTSGKIRRQANRQAWASGTLRALELQAAE